MPKKVKRLSESILLVVVLLSLVLGVSWSTGLPAQLAAVPAPGVAAQTQVAQANATADIQVATAIAGDAQSASGPVAAAVALSTSITSTDTTTASVESLASLQASQVFSGPVAVDATDAPLLVQAPGTINIMLLGVDSQGTSDRRYARTDTLMIASVNPDLPSVSLLSFPRDLQVRIPNHDDDRINTAWEIGYLRNYPGGGPAFLAAVLRKNFGIKIDHYVRVDFEGFVNTVDTLGGVDVIVECELHDTFPDPNSVINGTAIRGTRDLDVYPGKTLLTGYQALMYARSRESTTDFDRARRQQKVVRALFSKVKNSNLLANAIGLYGTLRANVDTDMDLTSVPAFVGFAQHLSDLAIQTRVVTYPVIKSFVRKDKAQVLLPTPAILPYIADSLAPPAGNRTVIRPHVEVFNASKRANMELVAADRLAWEGFQVDKMGKADGPAQAKTQIMDYSTTTKGSFIPRLQTIFNVAKSNIESQPNANSPVQAQIILGDNYNSCPSTSNTAGELLLTPNPADLIPTSTPGK